MMAEWEFGKSLLKKLHDTRQIVKNNHFGAWQLNPREINWEAFIHEKLNFGQKLSHPIPSAWLGLSSCWQEADLIWRAPMPSGVAPKSSKLGGREVGKIL